MLQAPQSCPAIEQAPEIAGHHDLWPEVMVRLRAELGKDVFSSWFERMELVSVENNDVTLSVPTRFLRTWIQQHYVGQLLTCWKDVDPDVHRVVIVVRSCERRAGSVGQTSASVCPSSIPAAVGFDPPVVASRLDPSLTFDTLVVGQSNLVAHAAARDIVDGGPNSSSANPLYIYGRVGFGKTHLLHSIALAARFAGRKVAYFPAEKFVFGFVSAMRSQGVGPGIAAFRNSLRDIDLALIDDIQFLQGRTVLTEFSFLLESMSEAGRQIVVAAADRPHDLGYMDQRAQSRLGRGLVIEVGLDFDMRSEIISRRLGSMDPRLNLDQQAIEFVAKASVDGRMIHGMLNKIAVQLENRDQIVGRELAERLTQDLLRPPEPRKITIAEIIRGVARHYGVSIDDIISARRTANVVRPRQVGYWLAKNMTLKSLPEIGRRFGGRDHTSALSGIRKIDRLREIDASLVEEIEIVRKKVLENVG